MLSLLIGGFLVVFALPLGALVLGVKPEDFDEMAQD